MTKTIYASLNYWWVEMTGLQISGEQAKSFVTIVEGTNFFTVDITGQLTAVLLKITTAHPDAKLLEMLPQIT